MVALPQYNYLFAIGTFFALFDGFNVRPLVPGPSLSLVLEVILDTSRGPLHRSRTITDSLERKPNPILNPAMPLGPWWRQTFAKKCTVGPSGTATPPRPHHIPRNLENAANTGGGESRYRERVGHLGFVSCGEL